MAATNHRLTVRYDGRRYFGWQRHRERPTIQGALETALTRVAGVEATVHGAGRTDRGAHADAQVCHTHLAFAFDERAQAVLDAELPEDIRITAVAPVPENFHARDSATGKIYRYEILPAATCPRALEGRVWHVKRRLDVEKMAAVCPVLQGRHDFASFATRPNFKQQSTTRDLRRVELTERDGRIIVTMEADGFLYKMVRNLVRALAKAGEGRYSAEDVAGILRAADRQAAPGTAPASGLYLERVLYEDDV